MKKKSHEPAGLKLKIVKGAAIRGRPDCILHSPEYWLGRVEQAIGQPIELDLGPNERRPNELELLQQNAQKANRFDAAMTVMRQFRITSRELHARALRADENVEAMPLVQQFRREMASAPFHGPVQIKIKPAKRRKS